MTCNVVFVYWNRTNRYLELITAVCFGIKKKKKTPTEELLKLYCLLSTRVQKHKRNAVTENITDLFEPPPKYF